MTLILYTIPMKTIIYYFSVIFLISIYGCSSGSNQRLKIGFLFNSQNTPRFVKEAAFFKERAEQLGAEVIIEQANDDENLQAIKFEELAQKDIDAIVIVPVNANTAASIVRSAQSQGIKAIAYNRLITNCDLSFFVTVNTTSLGKHMVESAVKEKPTGNYILLGGDKYDRNAIGLMNSIDTELKPFIESGKIKLLYRSYIESWSGANAGYELDKVISYTGIKPDVVLSAYDGMSDGCIEVLDKYGFDDVIVTGQDAEKNAVKNIIKGKQYMTLYHPLKESAYTAAEATIDLLKEKDLSNTINDYTFNGLSKVPTIRIESKVVTKDNINEILINSGFYTKEELY